MHRGRPTERESRGTGLRPGYLRTNGGAANHQPSDEDRHSTSPLTPNTGQTAASGGGGFGARAEEYRERSRGHSGSPPGQTRGGGGGRSWMDDLQRTMGIAPGSQVSHRNQLWSRSGSSSARQAANHRYDPNQTNNSSRWGEDSVNFSATNHSDSLGSVNESASGQWGATSSMVPPSENAPSWQRVLYAQRQKQSLGNNNSSNLNRSFPVQQQQQQSAPRAGTLVEPGAPRAPPPRHKARVFFPDSSDSEPATPANHWDEPPSATSPDAAWRPYDSGMSAAMSADVSTPGGGGVTGRGMPTPAWTRQAADQYTGSSLDESPTSALPSQAGGGGAASPRSPLSRAAKLVNGHLARRKVQRAGEF